VAKMAFRLPTAAQVVENPSPADVKALAHVTGGGILGNLPRALPTGIGVEIDWESWERPAVYGWLTDRGVSEDEQRRVFNLGVGMILAVPQKRRKAAEKLLRKLGDTWFELGKVVPRKRRGPRVEYR